MEYFIVTSVLYEMKILTDQKDWKLLFQLYGPYHSNYCWLYDNLMEIIQFHRQ